MIPAARRRASTNASIALTQRAEPAGTAGVAIGRNDQCGAARGLSVGVCADNAVLTSRSTGILAKVGGTTSQHHGGPAEPSKVLPPTAVPGDLDCCEPWLRRHNYAEKHNGMTHNVP